MVIVDRQITSASDPIRMDCLMGQAFGVDDAGMSNQPINYALSIRATASVEHDAQQLECLACRARQRGEVAEIMGPEALDLTSVSVGDGERIITEVESNLERSSLAGQRDILNLVRQPKEKMSCWRAADEGPEG